MSDATTAASATEAPPTDSATAAPIAALDSVLAYGGLYVMAILCIYVGSRRSVRFVRKHVEEGKLIENSIGESDAKWFPVTASGVLFSLYLFFKYGDQLTKDNLMKVIKLAKSYVLGAKAESLGAGDAFGAHNDSIVLDVANSTANATGIRLALSYLPALSKHNALLVLMALICFEGTMALACLIKPLVTAVIARLPWPNERSELKQNLQYELGLTKGRAGNWTNILRWEFDTHDLVAIACVAPVGIAHVCCGHWITNDVIGLAFSIYAIESLHLGTFKAGCMLLAGLFVYDVFWVFATDVMTTVATGIKAPILLQFPQDLISSGALAASKHAMLGLGDIVIPGVFLAMLLRFDEQGKADRAKGRYYFAATMVAYAGGLVLTIGIMHWFKAAQPALLYLVPACIGVPVALSGIRGETKLLWQFSEEHLVKKDDGDGETETSETVSEGDKKVQ